jgi:hypothetical protein
MRPRRGRVWVAVAVWLASVGAALFALEAYKATPGAAAGSPDRCPEGVPRGALLLFLHPHCPCSRASVAELAAVLTARPSVSAQVHFVRPAGAPDGWERTSLWDEAARVPNATALSDVGGGLARRLGVRTSGHALFYDGAGQLRFSGGITAARGHEGDNPGRRGLLTALDGEAPEALHHPVFGCPLLGPEGVSGNDSPPGAGKP